MLILAIRLRRRGFQVRLFGYVAAFESWDGCCRRLQDFIHRNTNGQPYVVIGHSLGTVLLRGVYQQLTPTPTACFFIAPPILACRAARFFAPRRLFKIFAGEMGQKLADPQFMQALTVPPCPTYLYVGDAGPRGRRSPFGSEANDGILSVAEATLPDMPLTLLHSIHSFVMNARVIADDIALRSA